MSTRSFTSFATSQEEARLLEDRGEEIVGYAMAALLDTFSRKRAEKKIEAFGLSRITSVALLKHIEADPVTRKDLAERLLRRAKVAGAGCSLAAGLAFIPAIPKIYVGAIAVGAVYCVFSLVAWKRYSKPLTR